MLTHSRDLFDSFMDIVVRNGAFSSAERDFQQGPLSEKAAREVASGKRIDPRTPWLCRISGKGGHVEGEAFEKRKLFRNVSLLDHLVSVARGAAVFAELDLRAAGVPEDQIRRRVARQIAVGFLHDADKMLNKSRIDQLTVQDVAELATRYRVDAFLKEAGVELRPEDLLSMIHAVEVSRSNLTAPGMSLLSNEEQKDCLYARLADRMESKFLKSPNGVRDMLEEWTSFEGLRAKSAWGGWRVVHLRSAHTPFLLNQLQRGLSAAVQELAGMPPLLEIHHDGELLALIPEAFAEAAMEQGISRATGRLRLKMRVMTNPRGTRNILDGGAGVQDLLEVLRLNPDEASKALFVHVDLLTGPDSLRDPIDELLIPLGLPTNYAGLEKFAGKHYQPWPTRGGSLDEQEVKRRGHAAALAVGLGCEEPAEKRLAERTPDSARRESELLALLETEGHAPPEWLSALEHRLSRQTLLAGWAAGLAGEDEGLSDRIFAEDGLLNLWLRGDGAERAGLLEKIGDPGAALAGAATTWLRAAMTRRFLSADENAPGRCHFTNTPVGLDAEIDARSGLDGLKVSAFSGREGRPEFFDRTKSQTLVSAPAAAEHRLRSLLGEGRGGGDVPAYVSTPTMMGLFASLNMEADQDFLQIDHYDLARLEPKPGKEVYPETQTYGQRVMFARHVSIPPRTADALKLARMMMQAALRLGRPVHVFKGLPTPNNAYVHFDFLPGAIERGMGGASLRLEQIPDALRLLGLIEEMADAPNLGLELALRFADPATRFAAACEALAALNRMPEDKLKMSPLPQPLRHFVRSPDIPMTQSDELLIDYARSMTRIQTAPKRDASNSERSLGLRIALEAIDECADIGQTGSESLKAGIAGKLEEEFERSSRLAWRGKERGLAFPRKAAMETATLFVERLWPEVFKNRQPAAKARRISLAIYQVAFDNESYRPRARPLDEEAQEAAASDDRKTPAEHN
ncbi:hypothetical protein [Neomegalonema sp.]|uniref:hypothetical protein n=1 Tax=Neomegalonema sp. TaxID=2039713 RepID=UPI002624D686|nr:hypothetical protein [Neomegalonema sp.]MDD2867478.1 hypothetical protein [Neomegalonema sp.]